MTETRADIMPSPEIERPGCERSNRQYVAPFTPERAAQRDARDAAAAPAVTRFRGGRATSARRESGWYRDAAGLAPANDRL